MKPKTNFSYVGSTAVNVSQLHTFRTKADRMTEAVMMLRFVGVLLLGLLWGGPPAHSAYFGFGLSSCARWQTRGNDFQGKVWILLGYWSGLSSMDQTTDMVGNDTDADAIFAEVALICARRPSLKLKDAVLAHYLRLKSSDQ
jgi:hypothetical protein